MWNERFGYRTIISVRGETLFQLGTRIPASLSQRLRFHCAEHNIKLSRFIRVALREKLERLEHRKPPLDRVEEPREPKEDPHESSSRTVAR
jgi:hypothetical protein